jgi:Fibronectin type III domain
LAEFKLPFPMLRRLYHVDDPASLTPAAFSVTGAGGAATTTVEVDPDGETVRVDIDGITFSKKRLRITGDTRPTRPRNVTADRVSSTRGKIRFDPADSRGSRVREYRALCRHQRGAGDFFSFREDEDSPLVLRGLKPGRRYECTVRARSRAGLGPAARVTMPAFPS